MALGKAPGPDGFTSNFFHHFWDMVKREVVEIVEESRLNKRVLKSFNSTFLSLIPKEMGADSPDKFRPIALCTVIYHIISKVIANCLKSLLTSLTCPEQSSFVEGCQILDGVILVHEVLHSLQSSQRLGMLIKLDIAKAYDKLSWQFICRMLEAYGFSKTRLNGSWVLYPLLFLEFL